MPRIYISYRRADSAALTERIDSYLANVLGRENILVNVMANPDQNYKQALNEAVKSCQIMLIIIGPNWASMSYSDGKLRLGNPDDFVRYEIEVALHNGLTIAPILVSGAAVPNPNELPESIREITYRNALIMRLNPDFEADMKRLLWVLNVTVDSQMVVPPHKPADTPVNNAPVFVSYSRHDTPTMRRFRDDLRGIGLVIWVDEEGLEAGTPEWEKAIGDAIRNSGCLVVLLSPEAERSKWVGRELAMAETLEKRIFPVLVRGTEKDAIPMRLISHQFIDARQDYSAALQGLLTALRKHLNLT